MTVVAVIIMRLTSGERELAIVNRRTWRCGKTDDVGDEGGCKLQTEHIEPRHHVRVRCPTTISAAMRRALPTSSRPADCLRGLCHHHRADARLSASAIRMRMRTGMRWLPKPGSIARQEPRRARMSMPAKPILPSNSVKTARPWLPPGCRAKSRHARAPAGWETAGR